MYIWNLENWYRGTYLLVDTMGEGESGTGGQSSISIYTLSGVRWTAGENVAQGARSGAL